AFENAIKVHAAIGGSTNAMIHLPAIAHELGWELKPELFDRIKDDYVACGAATAQPGLGFLGNLIGINRISVAVSYADNAGGGR
ncbi:dihydroxy-acid dehydratase, partial [Salmonella enterica subsp. enterica serovar Kentucky]|nr:dihydroxy-acid dehydratase [Salmonella enterica subsp. enterica serovar Kentucky]